MKSESDELLYKNNPELFVISFLTMLHTKDQMKTRYIEQFEKIFFSKKIHLDNSTIKRLFFGD